MKSRAIKKIMALVIIAALAVTMAVTLAACDNTGSGGDIAILVPNADHGWTGAVMSFAQEKAAEINAAGTYSAQVITSSDAANQISQIEDIAANKNYKSVVILPYDNSVEAALTQLANADVPFIMVDRIINSLVDDAVATVKGDNELIGYLTADRFIEEDGLDLTAGDKVLIIPGDLSSVPEMRNDGFRKRLVEEWGEEVVAAAYAGGDNAQIRSLASTGWSRATGRQLFEDWINQDNFADTDYIFTHDSEISMGIFEALKGTAISEHKAAFLDGSVSIAASSGLEESYQVLRGNHPNNYSAELAKLADYFDVTYPPEMIQNGIDIMIDYLNGETIAEKDVVIPVEVVDKDNVANYHGFS